MRADKSVFHFNKDSLPRLLVFNVIAKFIMTSCSSHYSSFYFSGSFFIQTIKYIASQSKKN